MTEYIPHLDDYEMPAELNLDPRKGKPNPYVVRNGAPPKKRNSKPRTIKRHTITLAQTDAAYLHKLDKSLSHAIRKLIGMQRNVNKE